MVLPLFLAAAAIASIISSQAAKLSERQIIVLERSLKNAKKAELRYYTKLALNSIQRKYATASESDISAKEEVKTILSELSYGPDGYFFVYDYAGNNIVHPRQDYRVGKNWWDLQDPDGNFVIRDLIDRDANEQSTSFCSFIVDG